VDARNLSRGISASVVDALKAHGHILVVKGGASSLARELDDIVAPTLAVLPPPRPPEAASASPAVGAALEDLSARMARALMSSDHVEDVFAEDAVIRRDILRTMREGLLAPPAEAVEDRSTVAVKLDTLGYVAKAVARRADPATLRQALDRAAAVAQARFTAYHPEQREAVFRIDGGGPDERLELEEAVADELADLAEQGVTPLPTIERRVDLARALTPAEQRGLTARVDAVAATTLRRSGCASTWDFADERTIRVTFTPYSDQDADDVEAPAAAFAHEIAALIGPAEPSNGVKARPAEPPPEPPPPAEPTPAPRARPTKRSTEPSTPAKRTAKKAAEPTKRKAAAEEPAPKSARSGRTAAPRSSAKRTAAAKTTKAPAKKG
jgi:hypothetical protein